MLQFVRARKVIPVDKLTQVKLSCRNTIGYGSLIYNKCSSVKAFHIRRTRAREVYTTRPKTVDIFNFGKKKIKQKMFQQNSVRN